MDLPRSDEEVPATRFGVPATVSFSPSLTPSHVAQTFFFISVIRNAFVAVALTFISWIIITTSNGKEPIAVLGEVPRGFKVHLLPPFDTKLIGVTLGQLPVPCVVLLLCHIAIGKCRWFERLVLRVLIHWMYP